jgi:GGDEF domain-containing protein
MYESSGIYPRLSDAHRTLRQSAERDGLTGVYNGAYFDSASVIRARVSFDALTRTERQT